jgi:hypothetical protein
MVSDSSSSLFSCDSESYSLLASKSGTSYNPIEWKCAILLIATFGWILKAQCVDSE